MTNRKPTGIPGLVSEMVKLAGAERGNYSGLKLTAY